MPACPDRRYRSSLQPNLYSKRSKIAHMGVRIDQKTGHLLLLCPWQIGLNQILFFDFHFFSSWQQCKPSNFEFKQHVVLRILICFYKLFPLALACQAKLGHAVDSFGLSCSLYVWMFAFLSQISGHIFDFWRKLSLERSVSSIYGTWPEFARPSAALWFKGEAQWRHEWQHESRRSESDRQLLRADVRSEKLWYF